MYGDLEGEKRNKTNGEKTSSALIGKIFVFAQNMLDKEVKSSCDVVGSKLQAKLKL